MTKTLDKTPSEPEGWRVGSENDRAQPEVVTKLAAPDAGPTAASAPEPESSGLQAHLTGMPDTLPETWCANCQADVKPRGKGLCPRCGRVLKNSFLARRHPVNKLRRDQLLDRLVQDYGPRTTMEHAACLHLAGALEQLEVLKPGSTEHARLVDLSLKLGAALDAVLERRPKHVNPLDAVRAAVEEANR